MLTSLKISGFRRYDNLYLQDLSRINFILGENNIGKTSLLEAVFTWSCGQNIGPLFNIPVSRCRFSNFQNRYWMMEELISIFHNKKSLPFSMTFSGIYNGNEEKFEHSVYPSDILTDYDSSYKNTQGKVVPSISNSSINDQNSLSINQFGAVQLAPVFTIAEWQVEHNGNVVSENLTSPVNPISKVSPFLIAKYIDLFSHITVNEIIQIYSNLKRNNLIEDVILELNKVFHEIKNIDMIPYPDGSVSPISILKDGNTLPLYAYGDGVQRWFYVLGAIALYKSSIICIDEIDTGFHPAAQAEFSKHLAQYSKNNNVQLFLTTHNVEFIDNFLKSVKELGEEYLEETRIITLRNSGSNITQRTLDGKMALDGRNEFSLELR